MVNVAETRMKEARRRVEVGLERLEDSEILLDRSVRIRERQDEILPLFALIANTDHLPSHCELNTLLISLVILMNGTFEQKYNFLFRLYDPNCEGYVQPSFVINFLHCVQQALKLLNYLPTTLERSEVSNLVVREYLSIGLKPNKDLLTEYELKRLILSQISRSAELSKILGVKLKTHMTPGMINFSSTDMEMGTFQRSIMNPIALLNKGMINLTMCKNRLHVEKTKYRPTLSPDSSNLFTNELF